jgi:hypothetical protein
MYSTATPVALVLRLIYSVSQLLQWDCRAADSWATAIGRLGVLPKSTSCIVKMRMTLHAAGDSNWAQLLSLRQSRMPFTHAVSCWYVKRANLCQQLLCAVLAVVL